MSKPSIWDLIKRKETKGAEVTVQVSSTELDTLMEETDTAYQAKVEELEAQIATLTEERDAAQTARDEHHADLQTRTQELETANTRIAELEEEVRTLGEAPAGERSEVEGSEDKSGQEDDETRFLTDADKAARAAHERKLKRLGKTA